MKLNSKLTWGFAWTGLALVLAVPSADFLTGQFGNRAGTALITSTTDPVVTSSTAAPASVQKTATVTTRVTKTGVTIVPAGSNAPLLDPVDKLVKTGKPLPDYISDDRPTAATAPAKSPALSEAPTQVAAIDPAAPLVAPMPFPRRPPDVVRPALPKATQPSQPTVIVNEAALAPNDEQMPDQLDVNGGPVPPAGIANDWQAVKDRKLTRYLEQNGLIEGGNNSASITVLDRPSADYDPNGFYLSDGPNNSRAARRARIERMLEDDNEDVTWF